MAGSNPPVNSAAIDTPVTDPIVISTKDGVLKNIRFLWGYNVVLEEPEEG